MLVEQIYSPPSQDSCCRSELLLQLLLIGDVCSSELWFQWQGMSKVSVGQARSKL